MATREHKAFQSVQHRPPALGDMSGTLIFGFSCCSLGHRFGTACGSIPLPLAVAHHAYDDRILRRRWQRRPVATSLLLDGVGASHLWPDCDLALAVRHVSGDRARRDPARMVPNCHNRRSRRLDNESAPSD